MRKYSMISRLKTKHQTDSDWAAIVKGIRKEIGMTRSELSRLSGVGTGTIENYENQKIAEPSIYKIETLLRIMGYDLEAIRTWSPEHSNSPEK